MKRERKAKHYTNIIISDDSSDISFTEVKLAHLYEKSHGMQRQLLKATNNKDFNVKFRDALKNVVKLDVLKEYANLLFLYFLERLLRQTVTN